MGIDKYWTQLKEVENKFNDYQQDLDNIIDRVSAFIVNTVITKGEIVNPTPYYYERMGDKLNGKICSPEDTVRMMKELLYMDKLAEEHCYMVALNSVCKVTGVFFISKGTVSAGLLSAREVYMRALLIGAVMIVICHNHPSGSAQPSKKDIETTEKLKEAGALLDIRLADHIIIADNDYYSFEESGLL